MKQSPLKWFRQLLKRSDARERENALHLLGIGEADLAILNDVKTGKIRLTQSTGFNSLNLGMDIANYTYQGIELLGGLPTLVGQGPSKLLKQARNILNTKALFPIEYRELLATLAAYKVALRPKRERIRVIRKHQKTPND